MQVEPKRCSRQAIVLAGAHGWCTHYCGLCRCESVSGWQPERTDGPHLCGLSLPNSILCFPEPGGEWGRDHMCVWGVAWSLSSSRGTIPTSNISSASRGYLCGFFSFELGNFPGYGASGLSALRPAGTKHRQHTPSPKKAEERHAPPESNYIWWTPTSEMVHVTQSS